jgi:hypothetical protein
VGDPIALARILGHANLKMVMKYCHPKETHTAAAMKKYIGSFDRVMAQEPLPVTGWVGSLEPSSRIKWQVSIHSSQM